MVNINLLEQDKLRKRRQRKFLTSPEKSNARFLAYALMVLAVSLAYYFHWDAKNRMAEASALRAELQEQSAQLNNVQVEAEKFEKIKNQTLDRINAIDELRKSQTDPLKLMNSLVNGVSAGSDIWLAAMKKEGTLVSIQGFALNVPAIADLIEKLENSPPFFKVEINYWEVQPSSIEFDLSCELQGIETLNETGEGRVEE